MLNVFEEYNIEFFTTFHRKDTDLNNLSSGIKKFIFLTEKYNYKGILAFESNNTSIEPWTLAQYIIENSKHLIPIIAANPIYIPPYSLARKILSVSGLYNRKVNLNFITGTSKSDLISLNDQVDHSERYQRLREYILIIFNLISCPKPLMFDGKYYKINNLLLSTILTEKLLPSFYLAGASDAAINLAKECMCTLLQMAKPHYTKEYSRNNSGIHFGILTRNNRKDAFMQIDKIFYPERENKYLLENTFNNSDSHWKGQLRNQIENQSELNNNDCYNLIPIRNSKSDCPYLIGNYDEISNLILEFIKFGISTFVIEVPNNSEVEFKHIEKVFEIVKKRMIEEC